MAVTQPDLEPAATVTAAVVTQPDLEPAATVTAAVVAQSDATIDDDTGLRGIFLCN
jgi:hypothetical protein